MGCFLRNRGKKSIKYFVIHHGADGKPAKNWTALKKKAKIYNNWHSKRPWANEIKTRGEKGYKYISYHYLIAQNGAVLQTQDVKYSRYHCGDCCKNNDSANKYGIAIEMVGNFEQYKPSKASLGAIVKLIGDFEKKYKVDTKVRGHRDRGKLCKLATSCPGKNLYKFISGGSKSRMVKWINEYKKTGKLPSELLPSEKCEDKLKKCETDRIVLSDHLVGCANNLRNAQNNIKTLEKKLEVCNTTLDKLKHENEWLRKALEDKCGGVVSAIVRFIKKIIEWLFNLIKK